MSLARERRSRDPLLAALREARLAQGESLDRVGLRAGFAHDLVAKWERGARTPRLANAVAWANALGFELTLAAIDGGRSG